MRIECPGCHLVGNIDDSRVPATGLAMTCPKCKKQFIAEPPAKGTEELRAMLDTCPTCQYSTFSDEKFADCPKCGLNVAEYQKKQLEYRKPSAARQHSQPAQRAHEEPVKAVRMTEEQRHRDEEARRKFGLDKPPGTIEIVEAPVAHVSTDAPLPVTLVGWGTVIVSILLMVYSGTGIFEYVEKLKEAAVAVAANETYQSPAALFFGYLFAPLLFSVYSIVMLVIGAQFLSMKKKFVKPLGTGAWIGIFLVVIMKLTDILLSFGRTSSSASFSYYAMGMVGDLLMAALWIVPFLVLSEYLKSPLFEKVEDQFK
jgi:predicted Zn finger-like uncharacterized protein